MASPGHCLRFEGCNFFRQRLVLSTLSGRPVKIQRIRVKDESPGMREFEASFIRLMDKITNGSRIEINETGTSLYYQPGLLLGGTLEHDCNIQRSIGYYLESLMCLAPFMKHPLRITLHVSPQIGNRIVESARSVLNKFLPDIYIHTDHLKGANSGKSPGFGLSLVAETTEGCVISAELASSPQGQGATVLPEDLGKNCAKLLLEEIYRGGCVDSINQSLVLLLMTLGQQDVSKVLLGPLSPYTIEFLRHLKSFFQIMFKIESKTLEERKGAEKVLMTCVGVGFSNLSKTIK
ncbi:hypothetical protein GDO78_006880 [Eleutherodactylus coqui]|uniref:RNA 3'-terminal phosphate cyclase-like protein n=1 Tax=Eleutherodactylus coqui TaxID=57060 RepID=A0A8J6FFC6_ELECQ|nr:hypothetical protein GDO78_006880 [Eleutherodactylus coqui]